MNHWSSRLLEKIKGLSLSRDNLVRKTTQKNTTNYFLMLPHNYSKNKCKQDVFFGNCKITNYLSKILYKSSKNKLFWVQKPVMSCSYKGDRNNRLDGVRSNPVLDRVILGITYPVKIRSETQKG